MHISRKAPSTRRGGTRKNRGNCCWGGVGGGDSLTEGKAGDVLPSSSGDMGEECQRTHPVLAQKCTKSAHHICAPRRGKVNLWLRGISTAKILTIAVGGRKRTGCLSVEGGRKPEESVRNERDLKGTGGGEKEDHGGGKEILVGLSLKKSNKPKRSCRVLALSGISKARGCGFGEKPRSWVLTIMH